MKSHFPPALLFCACLFWATTSVVMGLDIYVDNDDNAPAFTFTGSWLLSSATGFDGGTYRYAYAASGATATWTPTLTIAGTYNVYAYFVRGSNRTQSAPYRVLHAGGETTVNIDQRGAPDQYYLLAEVYLGSWSFHAGTAGSVTLLTSGSSGVYIADAIRFELPEDHPPLISAVSHMPYYPAADEPTTITARVVDDRSLPSVHLAWSASPSGSTGLIPMHDDGLGGDATAGDALFAAVIPGFPVGERVGYIIHALDDADQPSSSPLAMYEVGKTPDVTLVINELLASNTFGARDPDFQEPSDWIEVVNLGPDVADLGSFALSDSDSQPTRWRFPLEAVLAPGDYLVVWADGRDFAGLALHADFSLSASGERVILYDLRNDRIADRVEFGPQIADVSLARIPDQTGPWLSTIRPTPGEANLYGALGPAPVISVPSGIYTASFSVEITAPTAQEIRYTLDGSEPTPTSPLYTTPLNISATGPLRARAFYPDMDPSPIASVSYFLNPPADRAIPIVDIVIHPADFSGPNGIYSNPLERGLEWERPVHVTVIAPDGSEVYEVEAGVRMHGGYSRNLAKKSLRLYFRSLYGPTRWTLPWMTRMPVEGFQQLVFRSGANDSFLGGSTMRPTFFRDQLMRDWHGELGLRSADGFFVALHVNGAYYGIYNACERITDSFMEDTFGGKEWDVVKGSWDSVRKYFIEAVDGDLAAWNEFIEWVENHDIATPEDFRAFAAKMDVDNFLRHFALNIFAQNHDWPHNNWISTRRRGDPEARWTMHEWDAEWALGLNPTGWQGNTMNWASGNNYYLQRQFSMPPLSLLFDGNQLDTNATRTINGILDNPEGRRRFISHIEDAMNFALLPERTLPDVERYHGLLQSEVPREAQRWASAAGISAQNLINNYNTGIANVKAFLNNRPAYMRNLIVSTFGLSGTQTLSFAAAGDGSGRLLLNGRIVALPWSGVFFGGSTLALRPLPAIGSRFVAWDGLVQSTNPVLDYTIQSTAPGQITIQFESAPDTYRPNDVIFNEYWINDNGTRYASIENRPIEGDWIELLTIRDEVDLRGWRITTNFTLAESGQETTGGSIIFPDLPALQSVPAGTFILIIANSNTTNDAAFPADEFDPARRRMIFYVGNGNLDILTNPGFSISTSNEALVLLAPGATAEFADDIGIDFIAEGTNVTPQSFGVADHGVIFINPFEGIGSDDGAVFQNDPEGGFNNDNGADANRDDFIAGPGGWVVDPPRNYTGDDPTNPNAVNWLTPGARNHGQSRWPPVNHSRGWVVY